MEIFDIGFSLGNFVSSLATAIGHVILAVIGLFGVIHCVKVAINWLRVHIFDPGSGSSDGGYTDPFARMTEGQIRRFTYLNEKATISRLSDKEFGEFDYLLGLYGDN